MCANFSDDDEGKRVVNAEGDEIGIVADVEIDRIHVEPHPGITDTIKSKLGWGDADEDTYELEEEYVEEISNDEIRISRM